MAFTANDEIEQAVAVWQGQMQDDREITIFPTYRAVARLDLTPKGQPPCGLLEENLAEIEAKVLAVAVAGDDIMVDWIGGWAVYKVAELMWPPKK